MCEERGWWWGFLLLLHFLVFNPSTLRNPYSQAGKDEERCFYLQIFGQILKASAPSFGMNELTALQISFGDQNRYTYIYIKIYIYLFPACSPK